MYTQDPLYGAGILEDDALPIFNIVVATIGAFFIIVWMCVVARKVWRLRQKVWYGLVP